MGADRGLNEVLLCRLAPPLQYLGQLPGMTYQRIKQEQARHGRHPAQAHLCSGLTLYDTCATHAQMLNAELKAAKKDADSKRDVLCEALHRKAAALLRMEGIVGYPKGEAPWSLSTASSVPARSTAAAGELHVERGGESCKLRKGVELHVEGGGNLH